MSPENVQKAHDLIKKMLSGMFNPKELEEDLRNLGNQWFAFQHLRFGMQVRNYLRSSGMAEDEVGIDNWDDYYGEIFEAVVFELFSIDLPNVGADEQYIKKHYYWRADVKGAK